MAPKEFNSTRRITAAAKLEQQHQIKILEYPVYWLNKNEKSLIKAQCLVCSHVFEKTSKELFKRGNCPQCVKIRRKKNTQKKRKAKHEKIVQECLDYYKGSKLIGSMPVGIYREKATFQCQYGHVFTREIRRLELKSSKSLYGQWCPKCPKNTWFQNQDGKSMIYKEDNIGAAFAPSKKNKNYLYRKLCETANKLGFQVITKTWKERDFKYQLKCNACGFITKERATSIFEEKSIEWDEEKKKSRTDPHFHRKEITCPNCKTLDKMAMDVFKEDFQQQMNKKLNSRFGSATQA